MNKRGGFAEIAPYLFIGIIIAVLVILIFPKQLKGVSDSMFGQLKKVKEAVVGGGEAPAGQLSTTYQIVLGSTKGAALDVLLAHIIDCQKQYDRFKKVRCSEIFTDKMGSAVITRDDVAVMKDFLESEGVAGVAFETGLTSLRQQSRQPAAVVCFYTGTNGRTVIPLPGFIKAAITPNKVLIARDYSQCG